MPTHRHKWLNELTVVAVFFVVIAIGLVFALINLETAPAPDDPGQKAAVVKAPTLDEYRSEVRSVLSPFMEQASAVGSGQLGAADGIFADLVDKTQERLLRVRVPAEAREAHLSFVLLLDQWRRAVKGSQGDKDRVADMTTKVTSAHPWLMVR